jgi:hypothetical protein
MEALNKLAAPSFAIFAKGGRDAAGSAGLDKRVCRKLTGR